MQAVLSPRRRQKVINCRPFCRGDAVRRSSSQLGFQERSEVDADVAWGVKSVDFPGEEGCQNDPSLDKGAEERSRVINKSYSKQEVMTSLKSGHLV